jgi:SNF2 family DNA or RNA helicase
VSCSCEEFQTNGLTYCEHLAVAERLWKGHVALIGAEPHLWRTFMKRFNLLPRLRKDYRGECYRLYLPFDDEYVFLGNPSQGYKNAVGCHDKQESSFERKYRQFFQNHPNISSVGLLNGVTLYDYQEEIFPKMLAAKRCICSMIMGSGKTITSIAAYEWIRQNKSADARMLVIAPKSLKIQWGSEVKKLIGLNTLQVNNAKDLDALERGNHQVVAVTYQFATRHVDRFEKLKFDLIIFDEMQYVRNDETKAWKAMERLNEAEYIFGLSGTIIENRIDDLYSVMQILRPDFLGPKWKFCTDYQNVSSVSKNQIFFEGLKNIEHLRMKLSNVLFSYNKLELPKLHHKDHSIKLNNRERGYHEEFYGQAKILMAKMMTSGLSPSEKIRLQAYLLKARQSTDTEQLITKQPTDLYSGKLEALLKLVKSYCVDKREKIVVFSSWTEMLEIIAQMIKKETSNVGYVKFTGAESMNNRKKAIDSFMSDPKCMVFLASDAGGLGVDGLQYASNTVIHFELPWNPAKIDQRNARLHRIGQKKEVISHYFIADDSVETQMVETLYKKRFVRNEVLYAETNESIEDEQTLIVNYNLPKVQDTKPQKRLIPLF